MSHPYTSLPQDRFWRTAVADRDPLEISELWQPRFPVGRKTRIVTAGSCFAQHFARALTARGYRWIDAEPGPHGLTPAQKQDYHYGTFSFRTGNIYTPRMLRQWLTWASTDTPPPTEIWETEGRFFDPFRPAVEPGGFVSVDELLASRRDTLDALRRAAKQAQVFVFTLGLTESWQDAQTGAEYAVCPGTVAGTFDADRHRFFNHGYDTLMADLRMVLRLLIRANPGLKLLLTVSPVPLTATASGQHVLTATVHSKSLLRAVAGTLAARDRRVDYFPSYEIITHPAFGGRFYAANQRSVLPEGVEHVMHRFFADQETAFGDTLRTRRRRAKPLPTGPVEGVPETPGPTDLRCEDEILAAFAPDGARA